MECIQQIALSRCSAVEPMCLREKIAHFWTYQKKSYESNVENFPYGYSNWIR